MSLAATLAADGMRPASFLPSIKCSNCGHEIEIATMGDHICGKAPESDKPPPATTSNAFSIRALNASSSKPAQPSPLQFDSPPVQKRTRAPTFGSTAKASRPVLPQINADVANKPFLAPLPRSETPISPATSSRSGSSFGSRPPPQRSATSPMPRLWDPEPPSPEFTLNLDCAFPPFPFSETSNRRPSMSSGRRTPGSDRGSSRSGSRQDSRVLDMLLGEPKSPMNNAGENDMSLINPLKGGALEITRRRPSNESRLNEESKPLDRRRPSYPEDSIPEEPSTGPLRSTLGLPSTIVPSAPASAPGDVQQLSSATYNPTTQKKLPPQRPARPTKELSTLFLDNFSAEPASTTTAFPAPPASLKSTDRGNTFPRPADSKDQQASSQSLPKMPSEPTLRNKAVRPTLNSSAQSEQLQIPQAFPDRGQSRKETRVDYRLQDAPPVPKPVQLHRSDSRHRPSGSNSSTTSSVDSPGNANSSDGQSPVTSAASSVDNTSPLTQDTRQFETEQGMSVAALSVKKQLNPGMRAEQPTESAHHRDFDGAPLPGAVSPPAIDSPTLPAASNWPLESPMDPALQHGKLGADAEQSAASSSNTKHIRRVPIPDLDLSPSAFLSDDYDPYRLNSPLPAAPTQQRPHVRSRSKTFNGRQVKALDSTTLPRSLTSQAGAALLRNQEQRAPPTQPSQNLQAPAVPQDVSQPQLARRPTVGGKANCRGCGHLIEGKSVKAADGRLTGRWHKACFVCKTCQQPFTSADFYVIKNHPYCEQHYHEKNGSLCHGCQRGIEGQYLETTSSSTTGRVEKKYHPRCFTCFNCRMVLDEDYFEIGGRVFCERHALAAMRAQPGQSNQHAQTGTFRHGGSTLAPRGASGLRAEKRSTKLMTMS